MAYAAESSKRKLHRMLESISNDVAKARNAPPADDRHSNTTTGQPPSKRSRLGNSRREGAGLATALARNGTPSTIRAITSPDSAISLKSSTMASTMAKTRFDDQVTRCAPNLRTDFLLRLKTFNLDSVNLWGTKPDSISEIEWAKRGWVLDGKETVRCLNCNNRFRLQYNEQEASVEEDDTLSYTEQVQLQEDGRNALAAKYQELLQRGHDSATCSWFSHSCHPTVYRLPVNHPSYALPQLEARFQSVLAIYTKLSDVQIPEDCPIDRLFEVFELYMYGKRVTETPGEEVHGRTAHTTRRLAFTFALFGWEFVSKYDKRSTGILLCTACFRRLGLWGFPQFVKDQDDPSQQCLPAEEHREYCPWINGETQNQGAADYNYLQDVAPAWQQLARYIEKVGKSRLENLDSVASDATSALPIPLEGLQSEAGDHMTDTGSGEGLPASSGADYSANGYAEARDEADRALLGRWQRLKKALAPRSKKSAATKPAATI